MKRRWNKVIITKTGFHGKVPKGNFVLRDSKGFCSIIDTDPLWSDVFGFWELIIFYMIFGWNVSSIVPQNGNKIFYWRPIRKKDSSYNRAIGPK